MAYAPTLLETAQGNFAKRCLSAALLLTILGLLNACGGDVLEAMPGGGGGSVPVVCVTGTTATLLTWSPVIGAIGYRVYFGTAPGTYQQQFGSGVNVASTSYQVPNLNARTTYYFAVTSYDSSSESVFSTEVCKTTS